MIQDKKRKEVLLDNETIELLQIQAKKEGRKLKNYMEFILREKASQIELSDEYKAMMDEVLRKKEMGKLNFIDESDFRKQTMF